MSEFDMMNSFYQDQFKTMKLVLETFDEKSEVFIPKEKLEDITMQQIKDSLGDIRQQQTGNSLHNYLFVSIYILSVNICV